MRNGLRVVLTVLSLAAAGVGAAADTATPNPVPQPAATQQPAQEIETLDEIWVRGKHLSEVIEEAEDDFFKLYNKLNKDSAFDVYCGRMALNSGSMLMVRSCMPGFIINTYYDRRSQTIDLGSGTGCGSNMMQLRDTNGEPYYMSGCSYGGSAGSYGSPGYGFVTGGGYSGTGYMDPPIELVLMERRPAYARNVVKVVKSDERLLAMVKNLGSLYDEMDLAQKRYVNVRQVGKPDRKSSRSSANPRGL